MLIGQSVLAPTTPGATYYTAWMPRQGDAFTAVLEVMRASGTLTMTCQVETKNNEDSDSAAANLGSSISVTTTAGAVTKANRSGALELVRYKLTAVGTSALQWIHFRSNAPIWQPN